MHPSYYIGPYIECAKVVDQEIHESEYEDEVRELRGEEGSDDASAYFGPNYDDVLNRQSDFDNHSDAPVIDISSKDIESEMESFKKQAAEFIEWAEGFGPVVIKWGVVPGYF